MRFKLAGFVGLVAVLVTIGVACGKKYPQECLKCYHNGVVDLDCLKICGVPVPTPTVAPTSTVTATPSPSPTEASQATPTLTWEVRQKFVNGFHGCNPRASEAEALASPRTTCSGDRTALFEMPGFDLVPKGTGCQELAGTGFDVAACLRNDSPGTPCGGAPACDQDHLGCPRTWVGCQGQEWDTAKPSPGSHLLWKGGVSCRDINGFAFVCTGTPGAVYEICSEPWPNATTVDGRRVIGGRIHCRAGYF
jgi:hypothetical protein